MTTTNPNTAFKTTDNTRRHNHTILHHIGRRLLLLTTLLAMAVGVKAQQTAVSELSELNNTSAYTIKSMTRGFLYYDPTHPDYVTSSSHTNLVNATPTGAVEQQFAFLRGERTPEDQYYIYSISAKKFVTYSGSGVALNLTNDLATLSASANCTWNLAKNGDYFTIKVPGTPQTYINITNWQANYGCKVTSTAPDEGNKMTLVKVATVSLQDALTAIDKYEPCNPPVISISEWEVNISVPDDCNVYYTIDGSEPSATNGTLYTNTFLHKDFPVGTIIKAIATREGYTNSEVVTLNAKTPTPSFTFNADASKVIISGSSPSTKIYYSIDGTPDGNSTPTLGQVEVNRAENVGKVIRVFALDEGCLKSELATYTIPSVTTISSLSEIPSDATGAYTLAGPIDDASGHTPIENFCGSFNGGYHTISNLKVPLFASTNGATIKNVILENASVSSTGNVGGIVGTAQGTTRIYNCGVLSGSIGGGTNTGSIVGELQGSARVINCYSFANVSGTTVGGIVGNNSVVSTADNLQTLVMNCIYYGNLTGTYNYPIFGGNDITNNSELNTYNFFRLSNTTQYTKYNHAQAITRDDYLTRFEFYRNILNSHRELAAIYALNNANQYGEIGKWILDPTKKVDFPIVGQPTKYTRKTLDRTIPSTSEEYKGKKVKDINVAIYINGGLVYNGTLPVTDMNKEKWDYTYGKIVLPFANEFPGWSIDNDKIITGWQISSNDYYHEENALFDNSNYVYAQGGNYIIPEGVTTITLTAYIAPAIYLSDATYDIVYDSEYSDALERGGNTPVLYKGQKVYNKLADAIDALPYKGKDEKYPYKQAIVLVGNFHFNQQIESETFPDAYGHTSFDVNHPFTLMSADNDFDQEPDYCFYQYHCHGSGRSMVHPIRFDFLTSPGIGMAAHIEEGTKMPSIGIWHGKGWFEQTETFLAYMTECELRPANYLTESPWILNGGIFEKIVVQTTSEYDGGVGNSKRNENHLTYLKIGGNAYINELHPGTHSGYADLITLKPIYVSGGEIVQCYMTGKETSTSANTAGDVNFYCNGGYIHEFLGAYLEKQNGNINVRMDHGRVDNFYGGGANETHGTNGNINLILNNSYIEFFCGGPKYGNMATDKTITINANETTFGKFYGGGYGGTALTRNEEAALAGSGLPLNDDTTFPLNFSNYTSKRLKNTNGLGVAVGYNFKFTYYAGGNGLGVSNFDVDYARLSLAQTNQISSTLNNCTVLYDFYGGGCQGRVKGNITSELTNCRILGNAFAGGYTAAATPISVYPIDPPTYSKYIKALGSFTPFGTIPPETYKWKQATDGHAAGTVDTENKYIYTDVDMSKMGEVNGQTTIVIKGTTSIEGSVFGGGNASKVIGNTHVHIQGGTINGSVFGAGNQAEVTGKTEVVIGGECKLISNAK